MIERVGEPKQRKRHDKQDFQELPVDDALVDKKMWTTIRVGNAPRNSSLSLCTGDRTSTV